MATNFKTNNLYSFTTINAAILGATYTKAKIMAPSVSYEGAKIFDPNIDSKQAALRPYLPTGASTKHTTYNYFVISTQTGETKVFADEWINQDSIKQDTVKFLDVRIMGADDSNLAEVKNVLGLSGWSIVNKIT